MGARVMFLDDSDDLRHLLSILLKTKLGVDCLGLAHLSDLDSHLADVLDCSAAILDINLGSAEPNGFEAYKWLKLHGFRGKIIFLTGHAHSDPEVVRLSRLGVALLEKPLDTDQLLKLIGAAG